MAEIQDIIPPYEIELNIRALQPLEIDSLGTLRWFEHHERLQKLHQQAILEAREFREETVKEMLLSHNKVSVLVYDVICVSVWSEKVLPLLLDVQPEPRTTMVPYMVLFHEATAIEFLETILYHQDSCEALAESSLELIDYAVFAISCLLAKDNKEKCEKQGDMSATEDLIYKQKSIFFHIGMKCITILGCIIQHLNSLPLSASVRLYSKHDIPILFSSLIETAPWSKTVDGKTLKYIDNEWKEVRGEGKVKLTRVEAQIWLALRNLVLDPHCQTYYSINDYRKNCLIRLQRFLTEVLLDQLSPLVDLKYWLARLAAVNPPSTSPNPLLLEVLPEVRQKLLKRSSKSWKKLALKHAETMFNEEDTHMKQINERLHEAYNLDAMELLSLADPECVACGEKGKKKCSRCKAPYCSRECQVKDWPVHKESCDKAANSRQTNEK